MMSKKSKSGKIILHYIKQFRFLFVMLFICIIATTVSGSLYPYIFGLLVDEVFTKKDISMFVYIVALYAAVFVVNQCLHFILNMSWAKLMVKYIYKIREDMFSVFQRLPSIELADRKSGDIIQRINWDSEQFLSFVHKNIFYLIASALEFSLSLGFIFFLNVYMGILVAVISPIIVYLSRHFSRKIGEYYKLRTKLNGDRNAWLFEVISHIHEIKLLGASDIISDEYKEQNERFFDNKFATDREEVKLEQINKGISLAAQLSVFALAMVLIYNDISTIGATVAILGYFDVCVSSFASINKKIVALKENKAGIDRCIEVLEKKSEDYNDDGLKHSILNASIEFQNLSFSYNENVPVLKNINFTIRENETVGIVASSGGGKTTLSMMINKLFCPCEGKLLIDGIDVKKYNLSFLRNQIGVVYQESCFFNGSIRFNLIFCEDKSKDEKLMDILEKVNLKGFISELPDGLDTIIMDGKRNLSGGQKQRMAIARAFIKSPKIMIFDEATSALDSESEDVVQKSWSDLFPETTKIIIAHRLSTIRSADRIIVLNNGELEAIGTHNELMDKSQRYKELFAEQAAMEILP